MRNKLMTIAMALGLVFGGAAVAQADPGPNGNNDHGLCTAYFNGQKKGHDKHGSPGPFAALEDAADEAGDDDGVGTPQEVYEFCQAAGIGGNPGENGRFTDCFDDGDCENGSA